MPATHISHNDVIPEEYDRTMTINSSRTMNGQLVRGATDGKVRNMRPDTADADYAAAQLRSQQLHPSMYGTFGNGGDNVSPHLRDMMPDAATRAAKRDAGIKGY